MGRYTKEDVLRLVQEEDVEFIRLQFTDIFGSLKNVAITVSQLERALENRCMFDGSAIEGFVRINESDMYLHPDVDTFEIFPWRPQQGKVARMMCDVYGTDGKPFEGDPRYVLKKELKRAKDMGLNFMVGPELEFFLFQTDEKGRPTVKTDECAGYFDVSPMDHGENVRRDIILNLEKMNFEVEASHHELAPGQHEIDLRYEDALRTADNIMTFRMTVKTIAQRHGLHATFMPKPREGVNGSGLHINMSMEDFLGKNLFADENDELLMSRMAYQFMAGLLTHMREISLLTNPIINSYKRLIPGFEAPSCVAWSAVANRSTLIRIPSLRGNNTRIELRCPDSAANPYLALAACLAAGLDGIEKQMMPPASVDGNIYEMEPAQMQEKGIEGLPATFGEALREFEKSEFVKQVLGNHIYDKYLKAKKAEWKAYRSVVTDWEIKEYLSKF